MIKTNNGDTEMHGSTSEFMADLAVIVHTLFYELLIEQDGMAHDEAKRMIMEQVEYGMKPIEQLERELDDKQANGKDDLIGMLYALTEILRKAVEK